MNQPPSFRSFGPHAVLVEWEAVVSLEIHERVLAYEGWLSKRFSSEILELVPAYHSLAIYLHSQVKASDFVIRLEKSIQTIDTTVRYEPHVITLPVCYEGAFALDLEEVASRNKLTTAQAIEIHTEPLYKAYFLGFLPGFAYLGGLTDLLHTPRKPSPRPKVFSGAVGIGGKQTGIYPIESPGGWNIIGRTPIPLFDVNRTPSSLIQAGDYVRFRAVSLAEYELIEIELETDTYIQEREVYRD